MVRTLDSWRQRRMEKLSLAPVLAARRKDQFLSEVQQAQIPRVIDSPFLRRRAEDRPRHGLESGLARLDAVCDQYGGFVHPESEWVFASEDRGFYLNMNLNSVRSRA